MKDPLQTETTPYEVLGLEPGASPADIDKAFKAGLVRKLPVQKLMGAKVALERPVERALLDLFQYDLQFLARAKPNPAGNPALLDLEHRERTAASWENQICGAFPDVTLAHSLAVLWYWWALHTSGQMLAGQPPPAGRYTWDRMWESAVASWVMVVTTVDFWEKQRVVPQPLIADVSTAVIDRLRNKLHDFSRLHRDRGETEYADRFQQIELALTTETRAAREIASTGIRTEHGRVSCGVMMLRHLDLLEIVGEQVDAAFRKNPNSPKLKWLRSALSPYSAIAVLIENRKPQAALDAIEALAPDHRSAQEVRRLEARALLDLGQQHASLGKVKEALDAWDRALRHADVTEVGDAVREAVVTTCHTTAIAMQRHQPDEAIKILRQGTKIVPDEKLKLTLAELLTSRGIEICVDAQKKSEKEGVTQETIKAYEKGLKLLEEGTTLGSKRAVEQAEIVRNLVANAKSGALSLSKKAQDLLRSATDAGNRDDWDTAVRLLRQAVEEAGLPTPDILKKQLALALTNRAVSRVNAITSAAQGSAGGAAAIVAKLAEATNDYSCAICGKSKWSAPNRDSWMSFENPNGTTITVCEICQVVMLAAMRQETSGSGITHDDVRKIESARNDLAEAARLDPGNAHVTKNLNDIDEVLRNARSAAVAAPAARRALPSASAASSSESRNIVHGLLLSAVIVLMLVIALSLVERTGWDFKWSIRLHDWLGSLRDTGFSGRLAVYMAQFYGWPTWIGLVLSWFTWGAAIVGYVFGIVAFGRWANKDGFAKFLEIGIYVFVIFFGLALVDKHRLDEAKAQTTSAAVKAATGAAAPTSTAPGTAPPAAAPPPATKSAAAQPAPPTTTTTTAATAAAAAAPPATAPPIATPPTTAAVPAAAAGSFAWLQSQPVDTAAVAAALSRTASVAPADVNSAIAGLRGAAAAASAEGKLAAELLVASLEKRGGREGEARKIYEGLVAAARGTPYETTARFELLALRDPKPGPEELEAAYQSAAKQKSSNGWFEMENGWQFTSANRAALHYLMDLRSGGKFVRFLNWLREKSIFPPPYAWLFIFIAIALLVKVLELPWLGQAAKAALVIPRLRPEYESLQRMYPNDPLELNRQMLTVYQRHGVSASAGCIKAMIDLVVVIAAVFAFRAYAPQMALDQARFWWVADVTQKDLGVLVLWLVVTFAFSMMTPTLGASTGQLACGLLLGGAAIAGLAWWLDWPAWVMLFWTVLTIVSMIVQFVMMGIMATRT